MESYFPTNLAISVEKQYPAKIAKASFPLRYVSPHFFWLHIPGGGLFGMIFGFVFVRAFYEMWGPPSSPAITQRPLHAASR
jgi:hypothetical protein